LDKHRNWWVWVVLDGDGWQAKVNYPIHHSPLTFFFLYVNPAIQWSPF
jgi:hypothetical protein